VEEFEAESLERRIQVDPVGVIAEIIGNISDQRDVIRELLSNAAAWEVGAKEISISAYGHEKGLTSPSRMTVAAWTTPPIQGIPAASIDS
jgi:hypothetical protein